MKLSDQVCTLDQAKRLKELGINQEAYFSWFYATDRDDIPSLNKASRHDCAMCGHPITPYFAEVSAWTVAELGLMLPCGYDTMQCSGEGWHGYDLDTGDYGPYPTEAMCRGYMLIHLLETKTITAEEVNKRLQQ